jgi:hypothetical protein
MSSSTEAMIQDRLQGACWGLTSVGQPTRTGLRTVSLLLPDALDSHVDLTDYTADSRIRYEEDDPVGVLACQVGNVLFIGLLDPFDEAVHSALGGYQFPTTIEIVFGTGERSVRASLGWHLRPTETDTRRKWTRRDRNNWLGRATEYAQSVASSWRCAAGQPAIDEFRIREIAAGADGRPILRSLSIADRTAA